MSSLPGYRVEEPEVATIAPSTEPTAELVERDLCRFLSFRREVAIVVSRPRSGALAILEVSDGARRVGVRLNAIAINRLIGGLLAAKEELESDGPGRPPR
jgi:phosphoribosylaminoimidazole carboxylase (NCAIR synthetase)